MGVAGREGGEEEWKQDGWGFHVDLGRGLGGGRSNCVGMERAGIGGGGK